MYDGRGDCPPRPFLFSACLTLSCDALWSARRTRRPTSSASWCPTSATSVLPSSSPPLSHVTSTSAIGSAVKRQLLRCDAVGLGEGLDRQRAARVGGAAARAVAHACATGLQAHHGANLAAASRPAISPTLRRDHGADLPVTVKWLRRARRPARREQQNGEKGTRRSIGLIVAPPRDWSSWPRIGPADRPRLLGHHGRAPAVGATQIQNRQRFGPTDDACARDTASRTENRWRRSLCHG